MTLEEEKVFLLGSEYTSRKVSKEFTPTFEDFVVKTNAYSNFENCFTPFLIEETDDCFKVVYNRTLEKHFDRNTRQAQLAVSELDALVNTLTRLLCYIYLDVCEPFAVYSLDDFYFFAGDWFLFPPYITEKGVGNQNVVYAPEFLKHGIVDKESTAFVIGALIQSFDTLGRFSKLVQQLTHPDRGLRSQYVESLIKNFVDAKTTDEIVELLTSSWEASRRIRVVNLLTKDLLTYKYNLYHIYRQVSKNIPFLLLGDDITNAAREVLRKYKSRMDYEDIANLLPCISSNCKFDTVVATIAEAFRESEKIVIEVTNFEDADHLIRKFISTMMTLLPNTSIIILSNKARAADFTFQIQGETSGASVERDIERLSADARKLSVLGKSFSMDDLRFAQDLLDADIENTLSFLRANGFLKSYGRNFFFEEDLWSQVYERIPESERKSMHLALAERYASQISPYNDAILKAAYHFEQAGEHKKALILYLRTIKWNSERYLYSVSRILDFINKAENILAKLGRKSYALQSLKARYSYLTRNFELFLGESGFESEPGKYVFPIFQLLGTEATDELKRFADSLKLDTAFKKKVAQLVSFMLNENLPPSEIEHFVKSIRLSTPHFLMLKVEALKLLATRYGIHDSKVKAMFFEILEKITESGYRALEIDVYHYLGLLEKHPRLSLSYLFKAVQTANEIGFEKRTWKPILSIVRKQLLFGQLKESLRELRNLETSLETHCKDRLTPEVFDVMCLNLLAELYSKVLSNSEAVKVARNVDLPEISDSTPPTAEFKNLVFANIISLITQRDFSDAKKLIDYLEHAEKTCGFIQPSERLYWSLESIKYEREDLQILKELIEIASGGVLSEKEAGTLTTTLEGVEKKIYKRLQIGDFWLKDIVYSFADTVSVGHTKRLETVLQRMSEAYANDFLLLPLLYVKLTMRKLSKMLGKKLKASILELEIENLRNALLGEASDRFELILNVAKEMSIEMTPEQAVNFIATVLMELYRPSELFVELVDHKSGTKVSVATSRQIPSGNVFSLSPLEVKISHEIDEHSVFTWYISKKSKTNAFRVTSERLKNEIMTFDEVFLGKVRTLVFRERANKDPLTQLYNRWYFVRYIERIRDDFIVTGQPFTVFLADIDHFKKINDSYGHSTGDEVLRSVAGLLRETANDKGFFVARFGGEEFVGIGKCSKEEMRNICEELRVSVKSSLEPKFGFPVTMSIGVASVQEEANITNLLGLADNRLYRAKQLGRNRVVDS